MPDTNTNEFNKSQPLPPPAEETSTEKIEEQFKLYTERDDIAILLINQYVRLHFPPKPSRRAIRVASPQRHRAFLRPVLVFRKPPL